MPAESSCPSCGGKLRYLGEDVSEVLERVPEQFKVIRHVRPKLSCSCCSQIVQAPAPSRPIERSIAGPGLLAHILTAKYCDHQPLYRQSQIYARDGIDLDRSTLAGMVGRCGALVTPLAAAIGKHVKGALKIHADDIPIPVLSPGNGKTKTGRLWVYVRDDRPWADPAPPAVWFRYSPDRKGERPLEHLKDYQGMLQADGYAGFNRLYETGRAVEVACWAHVRRPFYEISVAADSPIAREALERIQALFAIEAEIRGRPAEERRTLRQSRAGPLLDDLHRWFHSTLSQLSRKSPLALAIRYALTRWTALTRYRDDGRLELENNAAERALRAVAIGRKNFLFLGADSGGERAAAIYSLIGTAKLNGPQSRGLPTVRSRAHRRSPDQPYRRVAAVERRTRTRRAARARRVKRPPTPKPASTPWPNIEAFFEAGEGDISLGGIGYNPTLRHTAIASDENNMLVALVRRQGETLHQLLDRLEQALGPAIEDSVFVDEINGPSPPPEKSIRR